MAEIIFQGKNDAKRFYHHLIKYMNSTTEIEMILLFEDQNIVRVLESGLKNDYIENVKNAFYEFIIKVKRDDWFRETLKEQYYFADPEEIQQILDIIYSILEGEREDLAIFLNETNEEARIKEAVDQVFNENISLSFDSFIKFRLRSYVSILENYVKISIDEYKMEQEYQMFVQTLRDFLSNQESKMDELYLLLDEEITFYNQNLTEIKRAELTRMIDRKLLFNHPVYVDSASIAPLLSIAPKTIYLYTKNPEEPLVRTIKNIFEERVFIQPFHEINTIFTSKSMRRNENL